MSVKDDDGVPRHYEDAWIKAEGHIADRNGEYPDRITTATITHTEIPTDLFNPHNTSFIAKQSDLPQMYSNFAPNMTTTIYTTSPTLDLQVEGGVMCQHTSTHYTLGSRGIGSDVKYSTQSFSDYGMVNVNFGNNTICLMDKE